MTSFSGVDYLDFDSLLSDEEKLARNTARQFVDDQIMPTIGEYNRNGKFPIQPVPQMADPGLFGEPGGLWLRGNVQRRIRISHAGTRARGFSPAQLCVGSIGPGDLSDLHVRLRRAKKQTAAVAAAA
jgi:hypothetical protein